MGLVFKVQIIILIYYYFNNVPPIKFYNFCCRWWKSFWRPIPRGRLYYHRYFIRILLLVIVITIILILFSWLGQIVTRNDPSLDFSGNPHIRVANVKET